MEQEKIVQTPETANNTALEVKNLTVRFELEDETVYAVTDVSFRLDRQKTCSVAVRFV